LRFCAAVPQFQGTVEQDAQKRKQERSRTAAQNVFGTRALQLVFFSLQNFVPSSNRYPQNFVTLPLKGQNLSANEAVADCGVSIDQIGNSHFSHSYRTDFY
jgi:hypothetical protein